MTTGKIIALTRRTFVGKVMSCFSICYLGSVQFSSFQSLSRVRLFATAWIAACQASLSITISWSSLRLTSIESVMPSSHLILGRPLLLLLSRLVITFLPRSKHLLISWLQSPSAVILKPPQNKVWHCFHCFPIYFPWSDGTGCHDLRFLNIEL